MTEILLAEAKSECLKAWKNEISKGEHRSKVLTKSYYRSAFLLARLTLLYKSHKAIY